MKREQCEVGAGEGRVLAWWRGGGGGGSGAAFPRPLITAQVDALITAQVQRRGKYGGGREVEGREVGRYAAKGGAG